MKRWFSSVMVILFTVGIYWGCEGTERVFGNNHNTGDGGPGGNADTDGDADSDADSDGDADTDTACVDEDDDGWCADFDCNDDDGTINPDAVEDEEDGIDNDCDSETDEAPGGEAECGEQNFDITIAPVRLMILQDVSASMTIGDKWTQAKAALNSMLTNPANGGIEFGFDSFPNNALCSVTSTVKYDCNMITASQLAIEIQALPTPDGGTPLCMAMNNFNTDINLDYAELFTNSGADRYLLIVSDGDDTCGGGGVCGGDSSSAAQLGTTTSDLLAKGIRTYVIGFGVNSSAQLTQIAQNGGTGSSTYITASDQAALQAALNNIAGQVASCTYDIDDPGGIDKDKTNFYFDGVGVVYNEDCSDPTAPPGEGWTWVDKTTKDAVRFCDKSCENLNSVTTVTAKFGCPTIVP